MTRSSNVARAPEGRKNPSLRRSYNATPSRQTEENAITPLPPGVDFFRPLWGSGGVEGRFPHGWRHGLRSSARFAGWQDARSLENQTGSPRDFFRPAGQTDSPKGFFRSAGKSHDVLPEFNLLASRMIFLDKQHSHIILVNKASPNWRKGRGPNQGSA